jgi:small subunit ribosomal protein S3
MGQKVNPHGLRVGIIKGWESRWYANDKDFGDMLVQDYQIRKFLKKKLYEAGVPRIEIERDATKVRVNIHCSRPCRVIGEGGKNIDLIKNDVEKMINKGKDQKLDVFVNIVEVRQQDKNAQLVSENIALQLEKRASFRRVMKQAIQKAMALGAKGIKIAVSGRLGGAEIARTEQYHEGTIPLQTLRANIDYGFAEADTTYGKIGVKVWIYTGEVLHGKVKEAAETNDKKERFQKPRRKRDFEDRKPRPYGRRPMNNAATKKSEI